MVGASGERRRRRVEGGGRTRKVTVRLTEQEYTRVAARAGLMGLTVASYLAEIGQAARAAPPDAAPAGQDGTSTSGERASGGSAPDGGGVGGLLVERGRGFGVLERRALAAELFGVRRLLSGVATNLNQLAKVANATGRVDPRVPATAAAVGRYVGRLDSVVVALDPRLDAARWSRS